MEFALNEILTIIDKVKSTDLALFEYQDADTRIRIRGTKKPGQRAGGRFSPEMLQNVPGAALESQTDEGEGGAASAMPAGAGAAGAGLVASMRMPAGAGATGAGLAAPMRMMTAVGAADAGEMPAGIQLTGYPAPDVQPVPARESHIVTSPMVGTFYAAASEKEEPLVHVGDRVKKGQTVGIVEAMKLMNEIESEWEGVVTEILVKNEQMVEYGQPLIRIEEP